jgi:hypothetical protein
MSTGLGRVGLWRREAEKKRRVEREWRSEREVRVMGFDLVELWKRAVAVVVVVVAGMRWRKWERRRRMEERREDIFLEGTGCLFLGKVREKVGNWLRFLLTIEGGFQEGLWKGKIK